MSSQYGREGEGGGGGGLVLVRSWVCTRWEALRACVKGGKKAAPATARGQAERQPLSVAH